MEITVILLPFLFLLVRKLAFRKLQVVFQLQTEVPGHRHSAGVVEMIAAVCSV